MSGKKERRNGSIGEINAEMNEKEQRGRRADNALHHVGCSLLSVARSYGEQFACFPPGSGSSGNADTSFPPQKMKRPLLGKSPLSLASLLLDPSSPVP